MKNILSIILILLSIGTFAQSREKRDVGGFQSITLAFPGTLYLKQGTTTSVELSGTKELLEKIETEVEGSRLYIRRKDTFRNWNNWGDNLGKLTVRITLPKLSGVSVMGSGKAIGESVFRSGSLAVKVSGSGSIDLEAEADETDLDVAGSGQINLKGSFSGIDASVSGSGKIVVNGAVQGTLSSGISGSGKLEVSGTAKTLRSSISGSGKVAGFSLVSENCFARISGSGTIEVTVKKEIDAEISGSGSVLYKGNPDHVSSHSSGSGKIKKVE
ncbi:MAG: head GIN domain-containing protein [Cyclobacteriaceae bacterium]